jgi:hypothetical protein
MTWRILLSFSGVFSFLAPLWLASGADKAPPPVTQSPHGDLAGECTTCHTPEAWTPVRAPLPFDHRGTGFPLVAAHAQTGCRGCHRSLVFSQVGTACADCHRDGHRGELGPACDTCHTPETWTNRRDVFRVHSRTRFPLLAVHAGLECEACHARQQPREFASTPTDCVACHLRDFQTARDPDHERLRFSRRCDECHSAGSRTWKGGAFGGSFGHPASFPLRGAHATVTCSRCHTSGFAGTSRQCVSCHRGDYDGARSPDHRAGGFSTECQSCHDDAAWRPATFDHSLARFPLTGAHTRLECGRCHTGGRFRGTPTECVGCHQSDYDRTSSPSHRAAGFPTGCPACHGTNAWRPATFDHNRFFPITSGDHAGIGCTSCHVNAGSFSVFTCLDCHRGRERMDDKHRRVSGYVFESRACYRCHPRGQE